MNSGAVWSVLRVPAVRKSGLFSLNHSMAQTTEMVLLFFSLASYLPMDTVSKGAEELCARRCLQSSFLPQTPASCRLLLCSPVLLFPAVLCDTQGSARWSPFLLPSLFRLQLDWFSGDIRWVKSESKRTQGQLALHWTGGMFLLSGWCPHTSHVHSSNPPLV